MKRKRIMGFFLALVMFMGYLPLNPTASYANGNVEINETNFENEEFRNYVSREFDKDQNGYLSQDELDEAKRIDIYGTSVSSLKGIEHFKNLTDLYCYENKLKSLDVSKNTNLTKLVCDANDLTSLDVSNNTNLTELACTRNKLKSLDVSKNPNLTKLDCYRNKLTELDVSNNTNLTKLQCSANKLTELDVSKNPNLTILSCHTNNLTSLDVSKNINLTALWCLSNNLTSLDVSQNTNLIKLSCYRNNLRSLDVSQNTNLTELDCSENSLTSLDVSQNTNLTHLNCYGNKLTSLDVSKNTKFEWLDCKKNPLISIKLVKKEDATPSTYRYSLRLTPAQYTVKVKKGSKKVPFDKLPQGFDKNRIIESDVQLEEDGFTWDGSTNPIKFRYQLCENPDEVKKGEKAIVDAEITVEEIEFDPENVVSMEVITQPKLSYTEGEKLDLSGLVVRLTDKNKITKDVEFEYFGTYKITTNPIDGTALTLNDNNKPVTLTKRNLTAETNTVAANNEKAVKLTKGLLTAGKNPLTAGKNPLTAEKNPLTAQTNTLTVKEKPTPTPTPTDPAVVGPVDPTDPNGGKPADTSKYWTVTFKADPAKGIMGTKNTVYVLKTANKTLADITAPKVTAKAGFKFTGWEPALDKNTSINGNLTVNAKFEKVAVTPAPQDPPVVGAEDPTQPGEKPQVANNKTLPKTANSMNIELYTIFMILSGTLLVVAFKRKKESQ
ncbi:leucine-rich repeat domain-containing protein [Parvimonas parva]|nr:leucine-rich repeat domain-containing protein [Parvimonas parva]